MKRALLVGIDDYDHFSPLGGCVNDVNAVRPLLARNEDNTPNFDCQVRTSDLASVSRDQLLKDIRSLLAPGANVALLYFAGHGSAAESDASLCTTDGTSETPGVAMSEVLGLVASSQVQETIVVLDCCFAGGSGGVPQLMSDASVLSPGLSILAASRGDQTAAETAAGRGIFSTYFCGALDRGAADVLGKVTVAGVYAYLSESFGPWDQRPTFKANIDRLHELRLCAPDVALVELRRLAEFFASPDHECPLDPSYEPDAEPEHSEHEAVFAILQRCRAAKLVEPVGEEHMYYAAMNSMACRLTPLGRHYWRLAEQDRL